MHNSGNKVLKSAAAFWCSFFIWEKLDNFFNPRFGDFIMEVYVNDCYNIEDQANSCYLHPDETFVGVCPFCLNERLIILASLSKNSLYCLHRRSFNFCSEDSGFFSFGHQNKKPALQKIFSLGSGIFRGQHKSNDFPDRDIDESVSTSSQEDSFISFKIGENGAASWEKNSNGNNNTSGKKQSDKRVEDSRKGTEAEHGEHNIIQAKKNVSELEHRKIKQIKRQSWHNRIGQLIKKKSSMRGWVCQVSIDKVAEGVEIRKKGGWIKRTLTKRRESKKE